MSKSTLFGSSGKGQRVELAIRPHRAWPVQVLLVLWRWSFELCPRYRPGRGLPAADRVHAPGLGPRPDGHTACGGPGRAVVTSPAPGLVLVHRHPASPPGAVRGGAG